MSFGRDTVSTVRRHQFPPFDNWKLGIFHSTLMICAPSLSINSFTSGSDSRSEATRSGVTLIVGVGGAAGCGSLRVVAGGAIPAHELQTLNRITQTRLYRYEYTRAQDLSAVLVLDPIVT